MKYLLPLVVLVGLTFTNCTNPSKNANKGENSNPSETTSKSYFLFDQVEHYQSEIGNNVELLLGKEIFSSKDSLFRDALLEPRPYNLSDSSFIQQLAQVDFTKRDVTEEYHKMIDLIFSKKTNDFPDVASCIAVYRDVLVFRNESKITGIASICFTCNQFKIHGSLEDTQYFGQNGDFKKLKELLEKNKHKTYSLGYVQI